MQPAAPLPVPVVNICTTLRQNAGYTRSLALSLKALSQDGWRLGTISIVCDGDGELVDPDLAAFQRDCPQVRIVPEVQSEGGTFSIERKAVQWSRIANQAVEAALDDECTHVLYVEADLCFPFDLIDQLVARERDIIAPLIYLGGNFYDSWGFRLLDGEKVRTVNQIDMLCDPLQMGSVGSCALIRSGVLRAGARFPARYDDGLFVGFCAEARALGFKVWADPTVSILHPTSSWRRQTWLIDRIRVRNGSETILDVKLPYVLAGLYDRFVVQMIEIIYKDRFASVPPGLYGVTIVKRSGSRRLEFLFDAQPDDEDSREVRIAPQVRLHEDGAPDQVQVADL